jgi:hypothetical protein
MKGISQALADLSVAPTQASDYNNAVYPGCNVHVCDALAVTAMQVGAWHVVAIFIKASQNMYSLQ